MDYPVRFPVDIVNMGDKIYHSFVRQADDGTIENDYEMDENFQPSIFLTGKDGGWKSIKDEPLFEKKYGSIREFRDGLKSCNAQGIPVHGMNDVVVQYIGEKYYDGVKFDQSCLSIGFVDIETSLISDDGEKKFLSTSTADHPITVITLTNVLGRDKKAVTITYLDVTEEAIDERWLKESRKKPEYYQLVKVKDERELLKTFVRYWLEFKLNASSGWNSEGFDMPYIVNRIGRLFGESAAKKLSPLNLIAKYSDHNVFGMETEMVNIRGMVHLDYLKLFKKYNPGQRESFKLDAIAEEELGEKKLAYEQDDLEAFMIEDPNGYVAYNQIDVFLLEKLDAKKNLIGLIFTVAAMAGCPVDKVFAQTATWDAFIYNELRKSKVAIPPKSGIRKDAPIEGAYVKDPIRGLFGWSCNYDYTSLYPSLMMTFNISPDTLVEEEELPDELRHLYLINQVEQFSNSVDPELTAKLKHYGLVMAANGMFYRTDKIGFIPKLIREVLDGRKADKKEMKVWKQRYEELADETTPALVREREEAGRKAAVLSASEQAKKILMNSLYGSVTSDFFRYSDPRMGESVTLSGQAAIRRTERNINAWASKALGKNVDIVSKIDTDSVYIELGQLIEKFYDPKESFENLHKWCAHLMKQKLSVLIQNWNDEIQAELNSPNPMLFMKYEGIYSASFAVAKKRYGFMVVESEDVVYAHPKLKVTGIEIVRSSTPHFVRESLKDAVKLVLNNDLEGLRKMVDRTRKEFDQAPLDQIAFPRSVSDMEKHQNSTTIYSKGCPQHVRAALMYNYMAEQCGLMHRFKSGDKIRFIQLKIPNRSREDVIAFDKPSDLAAMRLLESVDYETQWQKAFISPLQTILESISWELNPIRNLDKFFC